MASSPAVRCSLIVLNFEGAAVIRACVDSLLAAKGEADELIVVDNGSQDTSLQILRAYGGRIVLVALPENTYIFGLNEGLARARGRLVAFLNNDMTVERTFVDRCAVALDEAADDVFAVCPRILQDSGQEQGSRTAGYWSRGLIFYRSLPHVEEATDCFFAVGGQSFYRRDMLLEIGSIDPLLWPMYHEDIELSYRAWKRGWSIKYVPGAVAHHHGGHTSRRVFSPMQLRSFVRQNEFLTVWKDVTDWRLLSSHFLLLPARLLVAALKRDRGTLVGFAAAVRRVRQVVPARREAKKHFTLTDREVLQRVHRIR